MNKKSSSGFTIVELLVVIVVIGILAAITIVSYSGITAKANTSTNQANANSVFQAASVVYAETAAYPATAATTPATLALLNAGSAKISGIDVTNVSPAAGATDNYISYRTEGTTGICVGYWDFTGTPAVKYIYGGSAATDNGTTCS